MSEYSNRNDRGRLVGLVFSMQALGLIVGPLVALSLLSTGVSHDTTWRLLLGLGALPAAGVLWLRTLMPESPRFVAEVRGNATKAAAELEAFSGRCCFGSRRGDRGNALASPPEAGAEGSPGASLRDLLREPRMLRLLLGTAGGWLLFDYAYYGNTLSLPAILKEVSPHASVMTQLLWSLAIFLVFALPGYVLAVPVHGPDRAPAAAAHRLRGDGRRASLVTRAGPPLTAHVAPFLAIFGVSYLFIEFGPNMTTFVLPSELYPVRARTTGHGISAGSASSGLRRRVLGALLAGPHRPPRHARRRCARLRRRDGPHSAPARAGQEVPKTRLPGAAPPRSAPGPLTSVPPWTWWRREPRRS